MFLITIQALVLTGLATPVNATVIGGPIINPDNNHTYYLLDSSRWTTAEAEAISLGGHLVTINNVEENVWVTETFGDFGGGSYDLLWIGLNDAAIEGTFVWASGEPVTYTNWHPGEPNAAYPGEDYAHINKNYGNGEWVDRRDWDGNHLYGVVEIPFAVSIEPSLDGIPTHTALHQNYPNPFNPATKIKYAIPEMGFVTLKVYDVLGNEVAILVNEEKPAGSYEINFNAGNLSSGIYFYKLQAGTFVETKKMILLR